MSRKRLIGGTSSVSFAVKTVKSKEEKKRIYHGKKGRRSRATVRRGKGARKLFRYETHRAAYRVKGANLKKPLPRLSAPRCGGIKIQKEEAQARGLWNAGRRKGEGWVRGAGAKRGMAEMRGIGKLPCNLSHRRFEPLLSDRAPFSRIFTFPLPRWVAARKRKEEVIAGVVKIDGRYTRQIVWRRETRD